MRKEKLFYSYFQNCLAFLFLFLTQCSKNTKNKNKVLSADYFHLQIRWRKGAYTGVPFKREESQRERTVLFELSQCVFLWSGFVAFPHFLISWNFWFRSRRKVSYEGILITPESNNPYFLWKGQVKVTQKHSLNTLKCVCLTYDDLEDITRRRLWKRDDKETCLPSSIFLTDLSFRTR